jgi:AcrR family transcriptional regulator
MSVKRNIQLVGTVERKSRQKAALRENILEAAGRIVAREGFANLTMRRLADAIDYSPASLYLHFGSRDDIAWELCFQGYRQLLDSLLPCAGIVDPLARLQAIGEGYVRFGMENVETYRLIFMEDPRYTTSVITRRDVNSDVPGAKTFSMVVGAFAQLKNQDRIAKDLDSRLLAEAFWSAIHGIVSLKITCPQYPAHDAGQLARTQLKFFLAGLVNS